METAKAQQTILVVEDEVLIRMSAAAALEDAGFDVLEAGCSAEALKVLSGHSKVDILLTDVRMPGEMDGLDLVTAVQRSHPAIPAIVVSGTTSAEDAGKAGAMGFLPKPYMAHALVRAVNDLIQRNLALLGHAA